MSVATEVEHTREVDKEYLASLERKLKNIKDPKRGTAKQFISDIASQKDHQLFNLLASTNCASGFEDNFVIDATITPNYLQRKIAPQTCAINKQELVHLVKSDLIQKQLESFETTGTDSGSAPAGGIETSEKEVDNIQVSPETSLPKKKKEKTESAISADSDTDSFEEDNDSYRIECDSYPLALNIHGEAMFVVDQKKRVVDLCRLLNETMAPGNCLELVCSDLSSDTTEESLALLATFWVELDEHCIPQRHFGALFEISPSFTFSVTSMLTASAPVAYCRLTDKKIYTKNQHCCIVFPSGRDVTAYSVNEDSHKADQIEDVFEFFPELTLGVLPGAAIRTSCSVADGLRWSAIGFDTGYVVISVSTIETNVILDRKPLKFSGPISVIQFLPSYMETENSRERRLLVSSTLGPVAVWRYWFENETLVWESECLLERSQMFDTVTCACVQLSMIAIGTYSGTILFYSLPMEKKDGVETDLIGQVDVHAPVISMKVFNEYEIAILSTNGVHTIKRAED